jgi:hypothetical protein
MLKRERVGRRAIRQAKRSGNFIFISPDTLNDENSIRPTKVAFHELGHGFSERAGLHDGKYDISDKIRTAISDINKNTSSLDELFETTTLIDENDVQQVILSRADSFMDLHLTQMKLLAMEEARAEGLAHRMLERTIRPNDSRTLLDQYIPLAERAAKEDIPELAKKSMQNGKILSADVVPGAAISEAVSYSRVRSFNTYANRNIKALKAAIETKYGKEALDDPRVKQFMDDLFLRGRVQGQKTLLESIDSPIVSRITGGIEGLVELTMNSIEKKYGQEAADYYAREMGEMLGRMPIDRSREIAAQASMATETVLDRSGEIAAHASITTETVLPSLSNDASTAALSVLQSVKNTETEIAGVINSSLVRPIIISNTEQAVGAAAGRAAGSSTASRIISGVRTAMKIAGTVK